MEAGTLLIITLLTYIAIEPCGYIIILLPYTDSHRTLRIYNFLLPYTGCIQHSALGFPWQGWRLILTQSIKYYQTISSEISKGMNRMVPQLGYERAPLGTQSCPKWGSIVTHVGNNRAPPGAR